MNSYQCQRYWSGERTNSSLRLALICTRFVNSTWYDRERDRSGEGEEGEGEGGEGGERRERRRGALY